MNPSTFSYVRPNTERLIGFQSRNATARDGSRAVSLTPWAGDVTFNAASPGATPSASKRDKDGKRNTNLVPYGTEVHATRYQYGIALTPERLRDKSRAAKAVHVSRLFQRVLVLLIESNDFSG